MKRLVAVSMGFAFAAGLSAWSFPANATARLSRSLAAMTAADFAARTEVIPDPASNNVTLTTQAASRREGPSKWLFVEDGHARVSFDMTNGTRAWEIWHEVSHGGRIGTVQEVRYKLGGREHTAAPQDVEEWISYCGPADWEPGCRQFTRFKFSIPEDHVREVAATLDGDPRRPFMLELRDRKGRSATLGFAPAELGGLVKAFDERWIREQRGS